MNFKSKIYILAFAILSVIIAACNSTTTGPTTDNRTPLAVTNLKATSLDSATIKIKWDAPASQTDSMFAGYIVKRTGDDNSVHTDTINALKNPYTITGLKQGVIYTFNVFVV